MILAHEVHVLKPVFLVATKDDVRGLEVAKGKLFEGGNIRVSKKPPFRGGLHIGKNLFNLWGTDPCIPDDDTHEVCWNTVQYTEKLESVDDTVPWFFDETAKCQEVVVRNVELGDGKRHPFFFLFKESKKKMSEEIQSKHHYHTLDRILFAMGVATVASSLIAGYFALNMFLERRALLEGEEMLGKATSELQKRIKEFDHTKPLSEFPTLLVHTGVTKRKWYRIHRDLEYGIEFRKTRNVPLSLGHPEKTFRSRLRTAKTGDVDLTDFMDVQMHTHGNQLREGFLDQYILQKKKSHLFSKTVNKVVDRFDSIPPNELNRRKEKLFPRPAKQMETTSPLTTSTEETQPLLRRPSEFSMATFHDDQPAGDGLNAYRRRMASKSLHGQGGGGGGGGGGRLRGEVELAPQGPRTYEILNRKAKDIYKSIKDRNFQNIKPSEVQEFLTKENWTLEKVDGSHFIYQKNGVKVTVPVHKRELAVGTCRAIFKQIGLDR